MPQWTHSALIIWIFFAQYIASLKLHGVSLTPPTGTKGIKLDWVEKELHNKAKWSAIVQRCQVKHSMVVTPKVSEAEITNISTLGPQDEFSDISPTEANWIQAQYESWCGSSYCDLSPPNETSYNFSVVPVHNGNDLPLTSGKCMPAYGGDDEYTCKFTNLYSTKGTFSAHILEGDDFPSEELMLVTRSGLSPRHLRWDIRVFRHKSMEEFQKYIHSQGYGLDEQNKTTYKHFDGTTMAFLPLWHFNIGHALYDGLYPAFVALLQWYLHKDPFRVLLMGGHNPANVENQVPGAFDRNEAVLGRIGGLGFVRQWMLREEPDKVHSLFDSLVIGMGNNGQKLDMNGNFSLGAGRDLDAARLFRNHAYQTLNIKPRDTRNKNAKLQAIFIKNKRHSFLRGDYVDKLNSKLVPHNIHLEHIIWGRTLTNGKVNPSPSTDTFRDQILMISKTDIHITGPGTSMMYQQFLPDGAVHINLGTTPNFPREYMEEYMAEGCPYIRTLYYWPNKSSEWNTFDMDRMVSLIVEAKELISEGFTIPVPINTNLSPVLKVLKVYEYLTTKNQSKLTTLTPLRLLKPKAPTYSTDFFGNHFPHEFVVKAQGFPQFNVCLLKELIDSYGDPCPDCSWGFP